MTALMGGPDGKKERKCEAAIAVGALDPGVPYESRWAPYDRIHGPGQGQFPEGSIRPRGLWLLTRNAASQNQCNHDTARPPALRLAQVTRSPGRHGPSARPER